MLTGDTLFVGDVGRPDLLSSAGASSEELARQLYDSLHAKLLSLPDSTRVFPAHGAGSACGKNLSTETHSTIGEQRSSNYALAAGDVEQFVALVTEGHSAPPGYFSYDARRNRERRALLDDHEAPAAVTMAEVLAARDTGALLLDCRSPEDFATGHLAGSVNVGLSGRFAEYAGTVARPDDRIVLICEPGSELEAKVRLARIGYDQVVGTLADTYGQLQDHPDEVRRASRLTADGFADALRLENLQLMDVRNTGETTLGVIAGARTIPLASLAGSLEELDPDAPTVVYCAGGYRSSIAASLLRRHGFADVSDVIGGYAALSGSWPG